MEVRIFPMSDAASRAVGRQNTPTGYYNIERILKFSINKVDRVKICGSCAEDRGLKNVTLVEGAGFST